MTFLLLLLVTFLLPTTMNAKSSFESQIRLSPQIQMALFECCRQGKIEIYGNTWDIACTQTLYCQKLGNLKEVARIVRY